MPTQPYHSEVTEPGKRLPSVTTILSGFKDPGALMYWAWNEGKEGRNFRDTAKKAADAGTAAHFLADEFFKRGIPTSPDKLLDKEYPDLPDEIKANALRSFAAFENWAASYHVEFLHGEMPLVSEKHMFGGTPDGVWRVNNKILLGDYKTSAGFYYDMLVQVAAYKILVEEAMDLKIEGFEILRFDRDHGDFHHHHFDDLSEAEELFLMFRRSYDIVKGLKKRAK